MKTWHSEPAVEIAILYMKVIMEDYDNAWAKDCDRRRYHEALINLGAKVSRYTFDEANHKYYNELKHESDIFDPIYDIAFGYYYHKDEGISYPTNDEMEEAAIKTVNMLEWWCEDYTKIVMRENLAKTDND